MENKLSSVEWLYKWLNDNYEATQLELDSAFKTAKEMHREEVTKAASRGYLAMPDSFNIGDSIDFANAYYDNVFTKKK